MRSPIVRCIQVDSILPTGTMSRHQGQAALDPVIINYDDIAVIGQAIRVVIEREVFFARVFLPVRRAGENGDSKLSQSFREAERCMLIPGN